MNAHKKNQETKSTTSRVPFDRLNKLSVHYTKNLLYLPVLRKPPSQSAHHNSPILLIILFLHLLLPHRRLLSPPSLVQSLLFQSSYRSLLWTLVPDRFRPRCISARVARIPVTRYLVWGAAFSVGFLFAAFTLSAVADV